MSINTEFPLNYPFVSLSLLSLIYLFKVPVSRADEAIGLFDNVLLNSKVYKNYKHLNRLYYSNPSNEWLILMRHRYNKDEWYEFKKWLLVVIFDIAHKEGHSASFVAKLLR